MANQDLLSLFGQFLKFLDEKSNTYGILGIVEDGKKIVKVPNKPGYHYVRVIRASGISPGICINLKTAAKYDLRVKMKENEEGILQVVDSVSSEAVYSTGTADANLSVGLHTHRRGGGYYDRVEGIRFEPGGGEINTELGPMFVSIGSLHHSKNYFPGKAVDLSEYRPPLNTQKRWVKIGIDRDSNQIEVVPGPLVSLAAQLSEKDLWSLQFTGADVLPSVGIVLRGDQFVLTENTRIVDCRFWTSGNQSTTGSGDSGSSVELDLGPMKIAKITEGTATIGEFDSSNSAELFTGFTENIDTFNAVDISTNDDRININYGEGGTYLIGYHVTMAKEATNSPFTIRIELRLDGSFSPFYVKDFYTDWSIASQSSFAMDGTILHQIADELDEEEEPVNHYIRMHVSKFNSESIALEFVGQLWVVKQEITVQVE